MPSISNFQHPHVFTPPRLLRDVSCSPTAPSLLLLLRRKKKRFFRREKTDDHREKIIQEVNSREKHRERECSLLKSCFSERCFCARVCLCDDDDDDDDDFSFMGGVTLKNGMGYFLNIIITSSLCRRRSKRPTRRY